MATFQYIIKDAKGARVEGSMKANSMDEAVDKLTAEGGTVISVKSQVEGAFKGNMSLFDKLVLAIHKIQTHIPLSTLVFFTRQLATMFSAGLTIEKAISNLEKEEKHKRFRKVLITISNDIKKGYSLSEALEQHPGIFSSLYISLVKAGEVAGTLHTILDELAIYYEKMQDTRRKVGSAMAYPIMILIFLILVVFGMFKWIIPKFAAVYSDFNADLPGPTLVAIAISNVIKDNTLLTVLGLIVLVFGIFLFYLSDRGRYVIDKMLLSIPVIGTLLLHSIMSKFARTFSILMAAGVNIMETMELTENVVQNAVIESAIRKARVMVKEGYSVAGAYKRTNVFPSTLLQLTATGEETGDMDKLLAKAAEFYEKLVDSVVDRLTSLIEPLLIILMAGIVGSIIIVIYLPIFKLGEAMSTGVK
jgi:type IV pilus assembly protein PilC